MKTTKKVLFSNIVWDTDGEEVDGLPDRVEMEVADDTDFVLEGTNLLSNKYGWCVVSCSFEFLN